MSDSAARPSLAWIDLLKGVALLWIFLNHLSERILGFPHIANPSEGWPPLSERLAQLRPLQGHGGWDIPLNLFRYVGWSGDQGVQVFLILSGFALTWGLLKRQGSASFPIRAFYARRLWRIFPPWWGAHLLFMVPWLLGASGLALSAKTFLSMAGVRCLPSLLYYFSPAWWFIGLLIQLYLVYPFLWRLLRSWGPLKFLMICAVSGFAARALGLLHSGPLTDFWQRGAIFITRLPEFALGMALAACYHADPAQVDRRIRSRPVLACALLAYGIGSGLSLTLLGMAVAPFLLGAGGGALLYAAWRGMDYAPGRLTGWIPWIGRHSYSLFLVHHPVIQALIPQGGGEIAPWGLTLRACSAAGVALPLAMVLEWATEGASSGLGTWSRRIGMLRVTLLTAAAIALALAVLIGAELGIRRVAPQEADGWGERASLAPHPVFGWYLHPSRSTRLRWETYDYRVTANDLGFPGPQFPVAKPAGGIRIMTTGDAFTSAEGVDTELAWPRLLEAKLAARFPGRKVEVLNFAITGYGPNQYAAVINEFAPIYRPDLILAEFFVNDFLDVMTPDEEFRTSAGFELRPQESWRCIVKLSHLRKWLRVNVTAPLESFLSGDPSVTPGWAFGNFSTMEINQPAFDEARRRLAGRMKEIRRVADGVGARLVVPMVPASVQVCDPDQLPYFPRGVNLHDRSRFDPELPQRTLLEVTTSLSVGFYDLREVLRRIPGGAYQPHNMHWLPRGHEAVADYLAEKLIQDGFLGTP